VTRQPCTGAAYLRRSYARPSIRHGGPAECCRFTVDDPAQHLWAWQQPSRRRCCSSAAATDAQHCPCRAFVNIQCVLFTLLTTAWPKLRACGRPLSDTIQIDYSGRQDDLSSTTSGNMESCRPAPPSAHANPIIHAQKHKIGRTNTCTISLIHWCPKLFMAQLAGYHIVLPSNRQSVWFVCQDEEHSLNCKQPTDVTDVTVS
jgi:hypothetical protein